MNIQITIEASRNEIVIEKNELSNISISDHLEMISEGNYIVIRQSKTPRIGWDNAFKTMRENGDDKLILDFEH